VAVERRDREASPLTVGNGTPGRAIGGLHDRPVLVDVAAGTHAARTADEGVALRSAALQWRVVGRSGIVRLLQADVVVGIETELGRDLAEPSDGVVPERDVGLHPHPRADALLRDFVGL